MQQQSTKKLKTAQNVSEISETDCFLGLKQATKFILCHNLGLFALFVQ